MSIDTCTRAPIGWECTRRKFHDGPCAAKPKACKYCFYNPSMQKDADGVCLQCQYENVTGPPAVRTHLLGEFEFKLEIVKVPHNMVVLQNTDDFLAIVPLQLVPGAWLRISMSKKA